jgi:hypothetical protein
LRRLQGSSLRPVARTRDDYNTALEQHLREALGVRFAVRSGIDPAKRAIRDIVGVDPRPEQTLIDPPYPDLCPPGGYDRGTSS